MSGRFTPPPNGNYALNDTFYPVEVSYGDGKTLEFTINAGSAQEGVLYDDEKGYVSIIKETLWQNISSPTKDVVFDLYAVSQSGAAHIEGTDAAATLTTDASGKASSRPLDAGWYELVETKVPEGYAKAPSYWVEIKNNEISQVLYDKEGHTLKNTIVNEANKGKFILYKWDGAAGVTQNLTPLEKAEFTIEREVSPGKWEYTVNNDPEQSKITVLSEDNGAYVYESGYMEPGKYRITETMAPTFKYNDGSTEQTITFALDQTPQEFEIVKGVTLTVNAYNSPQGSITLTKYGQYDPDSDTAIRPLPGASFMLYSDEACTKEIAGSLKFTGSDGKCKWENLDPGTYYIKETADGKDVVNAAGYEISAGIQKVVIEPGALVAQIKAGDITELAKVYKDVTFINQANAGKLRIVKTNADGSQKLAGAEFEIYEKTASGALEHHTAANTDHNRCRSRCCLRLS